MAAESKPPLLIDTHIHLFRLRDLPTFNWWKPGDPVFGSRDFSDYLASISPIPASFGGFVFIETDRKWTDPTSSSTADELSAWQFVLEEYRYVLGISRSSDLPEDQRKLVRGIVPWAPVHLGRTAMIHYQRLLDAVDEEFYGATAANGGHRNPLLVGYRWLLQGQPPGAAIAPSFIEGLEFVRDTGRVFELAIDVNRGGLLQLEEALHALKQVPGLKVVFNHLGKPPLGREPSGGMGRWEELIAELASLPGVGVKLSGGFNELPEGFKSDGVFPEDEVAKMVLQYARPIVKSFGLGRIIWASDWPMCGIGYGKIVGRQAGVWQDWLSISKKVVGQLKEEGEIEGTAEDWEGIWGANGVRAYSLVERTD